MRERPGMWVVVAVLACLVALVIWSNDVDVLAVLVAILDE